MLRPVRIADARHLINAKAALATLLLLAVTLLSSAPPAAADAAFRKWINDFYPVAAKSGIKKSTYKKAFAGVREPDPEVLRKARFQPEFKQDVWSYVDTRVHFTTVETGQQMAQRYDRVLSQIERRFGVDRSVVLAIWSMESSYGNVFNYPERLHYVPRALATLAYADRRRSKYARQQLVAALKILQSGKIRKNQLTGSWAGAMGHTQFIPTSYLAFAVDFDGDGRRDIWNSIPDALATAANLLDKNGWRTGKTWGYEVKAPRGSKKYVGKSKTLSQWAKLGFKRPAGRGFPRPGEKAVLKMPAGANGPAFLMLRNFFIFKRYNNSDSYALAVGLLADRIAGYSGLKQEWPKPNGALSMDERREIQVHLKSLGYYGGEIDGNIGSGSQLAIKTFQSRSGLTPDGVPSQKLLKTLRR
ncbi:lytic murein transglycosylase [Hoeflea prorocentri]|uniref:Lytic murein transglycosylase n=1 Tax=Hoeflea prorocentri TaxID=1922333 RepID=A0A9X3UEV6_9HYPH|nr:lytic murein transglycosylase [Hoeflea prorocentri]MCY6379249.1 lytic murein transglycosylase [Hoeflea prorocentri]MDA5397050.1 lytic murein transglycosylase [Hoeflea prorocentri]